MADNHSHPTTGILHPTDSAISYPTYDLDIDMPQATDTTNPTALNDHNGRVMQDSTEITASFVTNITELETVATHPLANTHNGSPGKHAHDAQGFPVIPSPSPMSGTPNIDTQSQPLYASDAISPGQAENLRAFTQNGETSREAQGLEDASMLSVEASGITGASTDGIQTEMTTPSPAPQNDNKRSASADSDTPTNSKRSRAVKSTSSGRPTRKNPLRGASTNKQNTPSERPALFVNPGSAVVNGPFTAFHRPLPAPAPLIDESLRNNPYLKNIMDPPIGLGNGSSSPIAISTSTPVNKSETPVRSVSPAMSPYMSTPQSGHMTVPAPTLTDWEDLHAHLTEKHEELIKLSREAGVKIQGRERDKVVNRMSKIPNLTIEVRLKGVEGFKEECAAWDRAVDHHAWLKRRDFFRERLVQIEKIIARLQGEQA